jgi:hypothetical protein
MKCFKTASVLASGLLVGIYCGGALGQTRSVNQQSVSVAPVDDSDQPPRGSTYVPIDSWIYPALDRLHALGYINYAYLGLRPWTRMSITHILDLTANYQDLTSSDAEAYEIYLAVRKELNTGTQLELSCVCRY